MVYVKAKKRKGVCNGGDRTPVCFLRIPSGIDSSWPLVLNAKSPC